ncbi:MAG: STAS domain-containing protein, partial [Myxococcales bacterium]|nr:STAS domain-containing protein [Myxococcales bacterium]
MSAHFELTTTDSGLRLAGAVDRHAVPALSRALRKAGPGQGATLTLDLADVTVMDSAAVAALVTAWRAARLAGGRIHVTALSGPAERSLQMFRVPDETIPPPRPPGLVEGVGGGVYDARDAVREFFRLMVDGSMAVVTAMVQFRRTR